MHEDIISKREQEQVGRFVRRTMFKRRSDRTWPVPDHLLHERMAFEGNNGATLAGIHFRATGPRRGIVVLAHPDRRYGQHWFVREGHVEWLTAAGYDVLTFDFVQYGGSRGGSTFLYQDLIHAVEEARRLAPGVPVHLWGVSIGAFAAAVASPWLDVDSLVLESPYPDFSSWYAGAPAAMRIVGRAAMAVFARIWPATADLIRADERIIDALAPRILIGASQTDTVTEYFLSKQVADAAPADRTRLLTLTGRDHLRFFAESPAYRGAVLATFEAAAPGRAEVGVVAPAIPVIAR